MPRKSNPFATLVMHATGGQYFVRAWSCPSHRTPVCSSELSELLELRPAIWQLNRINLWQSKLT